MVKRIYTRVNNSYELKQEFEKMGRSDQFSNEGYEVLFNLIRDLEVATNEVYELDVIELCCKFSELNEQELLSDYGLTFADLEEVGVFYAAGERLNDDGEIEEFIILDVESL